MWAWGPHGYATPLSLRLKVAEYQGFHMGYIFFCTSIGSVRNWSKTGGRFVFVFTFIWIWLQEIRQTTRWIFQICKYCDHEKIGIPKLNVLYQISLSQEFKNILFFIIMSSNHEKMFNWNASIWVDWPCRLGCRALNCIKNAFLWFLSQSEAVI